MWLETWEPSRTQFDLPPGSGVAEGDDLGGADKGEVERVEEEDDVFATVVLKADLLELSWKKVSNFDFKTLWVWIQTLFKYISTFYRLNSGTP